MDGSVLVSWIEPEGTSIYFITSYFVLWGTTLMQDYPEISVEAGHYGNLSTSSVNLIAASIHAVANVTLYVLCSGYISKCTKVIEACN